MWTPNTHLYLYLLHVTVDCGDLYLYLLHVTVDCGDPVALTNGDTPDFSDTTVGSEVTHRCADGYGFDDYSMEQKSECQIDGYWSPITKICIGIYLSLSLSISLYL